MSAFSPQYSQANQETTATLITTGASVVRGDIRKLGPDLLISVRTNGVYYRFGDASTDVTASGTAATQGAWLPSGAVVTLKKPLGATQFCTLQDTGAAQVFIQAGDGQV